MNENDNTLTGRHWEVWRKDAKLEIAEYGERQEGRELCITSTLWGDKTS